MERKQSIINKVIKSSKLNRILFVFSTGGLVILLALSLLIVVDTVIEVNPSLWKCEVKEYSERIEVVNNQNPVLSPDRKYLLSVSWGFDMINENDYITFRIINTKTKAIEYIWSEYMYNTTESKLKWKDNNTIYVYRDNFDYDAEYFVYYDGVSWTESGWIIADN